MAKRAAQVLTEAISKIKQRRRALISELNELDQTLDRYGIDPASLDAPRGRRRSKKGKTRKGGKQRTGKKSKTIKKKGKKKRAKRKAAPSVDWLDQQLSRGAKAQSEIARAALKAGLSANGAIAVLKNTKQRFKSEKGVREKGQRGVLPVIWSLNA